jgi:hypothetical protein
LPTLKAIHIYSRSSHRTTKTVKEYVLPTLNLELNNKHRKTKQNVKSTMHNNVYKTLLLQAFREVFASLLSPPNFYFCIFKKLKINRKNKNLARV